MLIFFIFQSPVVERTEKFLDGVIENFEKTKHQATDEAEKLLLLLKIFQGSYRMIRKDPSLFNMIFKHVKKGKFGKRKGPGKFNKGSLNGENGMNQNLLDNMGHMGQGHGEAAGDMSEEDLKQLISVINQQGMKGQGGKGNFTFDADKIKEMKKKFGDKKTDFEDYDDAFSILSFFGQNNKDDAAGRFGNKNRLIDFCSQKSDKLVFWSHWSTRSRSKI